jgi:hypothetical protein
MIHHDHYSEYSIASVFLTVFTWGINLIDVSYLDQNLFEPLAHLVSVCSGSVAVFLGIMAIKERYFNNSNKN